MHKILVKLSRRIVSSDEERRKCGNVEDMMKHEGWRTFAEWLLIMRGFMAEDLLSEGFTNKESIEKDIQQRAYHLADEIILFLLNPLGKAQKLARYQNLVKTLQGATKMGATKKQ